MMSQWRHRREDVVTWPSDPEAREALGRYLDAVSAAPTIHPTFAADLMDLSGADLSGLDFTDAYLFNTILAGVNLSDTYLVKATLNGADLRMADLSRAKLTKAEADECQADSAIFRDADLFAVDFSRARLVECDFRGARLDSVTLIRADLTGADLRGASMHDAWFGSEHLPVVLGGARLFGADLRVANGWVVGPIDVGEHEPSLVDGETMIAWFAAQGATEVTLAR